MATRSEAANRDAENRRTRLRQWIDERFNGLQSAFVAEHKLNQGEISALLKNKSFGSVKARNLEAATGMPDRFLDLRPDEVIERTAVPEPIAPLPLNFAPPASMETPLFNALLTIEKAVVNIPTLIQNSARDVLIRWLKGEATIEEVCATLEALTHSQHKLQTPAEQQSKRKQA